MQKKLLAAILALMLIFCGVPAVAASSQSTGGATETTNDKIVNDGQITYEETITVYPQGGVYTVGFATLWFMEDYLPTDQYPVTMKVQIYAENGTAWIEIDTDDDSFQKKVQIRARPYTGLLYDRELGKNIEVSIKNNVINVKHFSRYAFS